MADCIMVGRDLARVAAYWSVHAEAPFTAASEEFLRFVEPRMRAARAQGADDAERASTCYTEWLLFDRPSFQGSTLLECYAAEPPRDAPVAMVARVRQVARTQFFSRFAVKYQDPLSGFVIMRDLADGQRYHVLDPAVASDPAWATGTVSERIGCVDGTWLMVGRVRLHDRASPAESVLDGPGALHNEDLVVKPEAVNAGVFLRMVRDVIGSNGRYCELTSFAHEDGVDAEGRIGAEGPAPEGRGGDAVPTTSSPSSHGISGR